MLPPEASQSREKILCLVHDSIEALHASLHGPTACPSFLNLVSCYISSPLLAAYQTTARRNVYMSRKIGRLSKRQKIQHSAFK